MMKQIFLVLFVATASICHAQPDTTLYGYVDSTTFRQTEITPAFAGGEGAWKAYLRRALNYPENAAENEVQAIVVVEFTINKDGRVSDITVVKHSFKWRDKQATKLIAEGRWVAAVQNGRSVRYRERKEIAFY